MLYIHVIQYICIILTLITNSIKINLSFLVLCADRLSQMTKTYNDIDAVTRLLEEVSASYFNFSFDNSLMYLKISKGNIE